MKHRSAFVYTSFLLAIGGMSALNTVYAAVANPWMIRARAVNMRPKVSSTTLTTIGGNVTSISNEWTPEVDFNYFFTNNISAELIVATARHNVTATGTILGTVNLGRISHLPPTVLLAYHFMPEKAFDPYVGIGLNHTKFYNPSNGPATTSMNYQSSTGGALQLGADYDLGNKWYANVDVKKIFISTDVTARATGLAAIISTVKINPLVIGVGVGYRFG